VVRGGDEVAQRLAGELAPAEQQVEVHEEALAAEAAAEHVVDEAEHVHQPLREPGLHAPPAGAGPLGDPWCRTGWIGLPALLYALRQGLKKERALLSAAQCTIS
jgi:hypothetical protein